MRRVIGHDSYDIYTHCMVRVQTATCRADSVVTVDIAFRGTFAVTVTYSAKTPAMSMPAAQVLLSSASIPWYTLLCEGDCVFVSVCLFVCLSVSDCEQDLSQIVVDYYHYLAAQTYVGRPLYCWPFFLFDSQAAVCQKAGRRLAKSI